MSVLEQAKLIAGIFRDVLISLLILVILIGGVMFVRELNQARGELRQVTSGSTN